MKDDFDKKSLFAIVISELCQIDVDSYIHTYLPTYLPTYLRTYVRTYIHTYINTYIHTFIETPFTGLFSPNGLTI